MEQSKILSQFMESCKQPLDKRCIEYIWIDGYQQLRSKTKVFDESINELDDVPVWNFCGVSTDQAGPHHSDTLLEPVSLFMDPFLGGRNRLVLCEVLTFDGEPVESNTRRSCLDALDEDCIAAFDPWIGVEQEYSLMNLEAGKPLGWPEHGYPEPQGPYYCGTEPGLVHGRAVAQAHMQACLAVGVKICGLNAEVKPSQWEYQVGPYAARDIGDHLWMSRYILLRVAEMFGVGVSFDPKVVPGDWNEAGAHFNFSTKDTRNPDGGLSAIRESIEKLRAKHYEHIKVYDLNGGKDNLRRLTGQHETSNINSFSSGVANRNASVRIPAQVEKDGCGYLEDRRPASNCDPYRVTERLIRTICTSSSGT